MKTKQGGSGPFGLSLLPLFLVLFALPVQAKTEPVTVAIPVECESKNLEETFYYHLTKETEAFQQVKENPIQLKGKERGAFEITYTVPGTYHYTVYQDKGSDQQAVYDDTVYTVDVYVTTDEAGALFAEPIVYVSGGNEKRECLSFYNEKEVSKGTTKVKTGDQNTHTMLWIFSLCLSFTIAAGIFRKKTKKKESPTV